MSTQLRQALERLDSSIDVLEKAAQKRKGPQSSVRNRTEVIGRIDSVINKLESFLSAKG